MKKVMKLLTITFMALTVFATTVSVSAAGLIDGTNTKTGESGILDAVSQVTKYNAPQVKDYFFSARTDYAVNKIVLKYSLKYYTTGDSITSNSWTKTNTNYSSYTQRLSNSAHYNNTVTNFTTHEAIHSTSYTVYLSVAI